MYHRNSLEIWATAASANAAAIVAAAAATAAVAVVAGSKVLHCVLMV